MAMSMTATRPQVETAAPVPMLLRQVRFELLMMARTPSFLVSSLVVPLILFAVVGLTSGNHPGAEIARVHALASFATYGTVSVLLYSFGSRVAVERGQRINVLMRATPVPLAVSVLAKVITALFFALVMLMLLGVFAVTVGSIQLDAGTWATLWIRLLLGSLPFIALGLAIGYRASPTAAAPIFNLIYLLLSFASGIFVPISQLPDFVQHLATYLPLYWLGQLAWNAVGISTPPVTDAIKWLVIYGAIFTFSAARALRTEEQRTFG
ncbi:MAG TPA: ABC transporter permease [Ktedonobacterales bacterium]|nr:ABC transporter permease [Ktedonobacterales bacterium]